MNTSFEYSTFKTPFWLKNPHLQTILPRLLIKQQPNYRRELIKDSHNTTDVAYDFIDADEGKPHERTDTPLVVMFHGLEGASDRHYALTLAEQVQTHHWHFVVPHYRSCGGVQCKEPQIYHAGDTAEIHHVLQTLSQQYNNIYAVGISIGGNMLAKYMGEYQDEALCVSAVAVSAPVDLGSSGIALKTFMGNTIYIPHFIKTLVPKALQTPVSHQEKQALLQCKSVYEFDNIFTASRNGFCSANEYYRQSSALPFLNDITKPTLIISAKDDPFLGLTALPSDVSDSVSLINTDNGGHVGFVQFKRMKFDTNWFAQACLAFFTK